MPETTWLMTSAKVYGVVAQVTAPVSWHWESGATEV